MSNTQSESDQQSDIGLKSPQSLIKQQSLIKFKFKNEENKETDSEWISLFSLIAVIVIAISLTITMIGDPRQIFYPRDPDGRFCGQEHLTDYPYIYFATPFNSYLYRTVCVKSCIHLEAQATKSTNLECYKNSVVTDCKKKNMMDNEKAIYVINSDSNDEFHVCLPSNDQFFLSVVNALKISYYDQILRATHNNPQILFFLLIPVILSLITLLIIKYYYSFYKLLLSFNVLSLIFFGALSIHRIIYLIRYDIEDTKKSLKSQISEEKRIEIIDALNSSVLVNTALVVFFSYKLISFYRLYSSKPEQNSKSLLNLITVPLRAQKELILLPFFASFLFFAIMYLYYRICLNLFSLGSHLEDGQTLPFQLSHPLLSISAFIILLVNLWVIVWIIQFVEFIVYHSTCNSISEEEKYKIGLFEIVKTTIQFRLGGITVSSLVKISSYLISPFYKKPNNQEVEDFNMSSENRFSEKIKELHEQTYYNYGYLKTIRFSTNYDNSGIEVKDKIKVSNEIFDCSFFDELIQESEYILRQIKYSISFLSVFVYLAYDQHSNGYDYNNLSQSLISLCLLFYLSYMISSIFNSVYQTIYSTFIVSYIYNLPEGNMFNRPTPEQQMATFREWVDQQASK